MQLKQWLAVSTLALATGAVFADQMSGGDAPLTRAEVRQSVLAARAAGQLVPAGEAADYPATPAQSTSTLTRSEVDRSVLEARAAGQLLPAGEGDYPLALESSNTPSQLTRAEVKEETRRAAAAGDLIPAGEGSDDIGARVMAHRAFVRNSPLASALQAEPSPTRTVASR